MVSSAVLACLLPAARRPPKTAPDARPRANTAPSQSPPSSPLIPNGGIGESPRPAPHRIKRSSWATFFAFSSKRRPSPPGPSQALWPAQTQAHRVDPASIPSPLQADEDEYYYSYYPASPVDHARLSPRPQLAADPDSHASSPVDLASHPYARTAPLSLAPHLRPADAVPHLRHATSQPFQLDPQGSRPGTNAGPSSHLGHGTPVVQQDRVQLQLKTSMSTPNLASAPARPRSLLKKKPTRSRGRDRLLSAESWWDALFSPSPRFRVKQAPPPATPPQPASRHVPDKNLGITFPSVSAPRPRAASATSASSNARPTHAVLTRSRSATDLGQPSTSAAFEPALETLVDESVATPDPDPVLSLPEPPLSLEQVIDEGEALEQQRAQWKQQATKSLGNKHTRSFSRARSKSLGAKHPHASESGSKPQFNLEFLAARTLLGSQSTMPTVHVTKPSTSTSYSKTYSHSHSQSAYSHTSHSHAYSHSHSHSLTTSNSSKSSRNCLPRAHSRNESWSKTAFLKAGSLCGIGQDDSCDVDEKVPSSSRVDVQGTAHIGSSTHTRGGSDASKAPQTVPGAEVGVAISSSPQLEGCFDLKLPGHPYVSGGRHQESDRESRWSSKYTQKSSEYAGPHPSAIDANLPPLGVANEVSLRHRLPPRAAIHPPIAPIPHPYRSAPTQPEPTGDGPTSRGTKDKEEPEPGTGHGFYPHISLSHADFERYGIGEALVYASQPQQEAPAAKQTSAESERLLPVQQPSPEEQSSRETVVLRPEEPDTSSLAMRSPPSLTGSTIQMVVSALDNPEELDEFQDLFYKPQPASRDRHQGLSRAIPQLPADVRSSTSSSPLTHLVRKLSEEVRSLRDLSRPPSDLQCDPQDQPSSENGAKFVLTDLTRTSSTPPSMESSSHAHLPIQEEGGSTAQLPVVILEDVNSTYTASVLENPEEYENDTFGYPIKHGQFEAATAPAPVQSLDRASTHPSVEEDEDEEDAGTSLSPVTRRLGLTLVDPAARSSYLTTSDVSQMSALSDFPLPPGMRLGGPADRLSVLDSYFEATPNSPQSQNHDRTETAQGDERTDDEAEPLGDVNETLRALRTETRVTSLESHGSTFGGSDDMEFITQLHQT